MENTQAQYVLDQALHLLGEHFEAVQIFATFSEEGVSHCAKKGCGNFYTRKGMVQEFVEEQNALSIAREIKLEED